MLVRFTNNKGEDVWVNPIYVRLLTRKRKHTEIVMSQSSLSTHGVVRIDAPMEDVAALLNDAMPPMNYLPDIDDAGDDASSTTVPGMF